MKFTRHLFTGFLMVALWSCAGEQPDERACKKQIVVSPHRIANQVGMKILHSGGNAFDAAVAVHMALAVVYPRAGNIGGGGFAVFGTEKGTAGALDFRETAPMAASSDMYLDENGNVIKGKSTEGIFSAGVPGSVAGMVALHDRYGRLPWEQLLSDAVRLARKGFVVSGKQAAVFNRFQEKLLTINGPNPFVHKRGYWQEGDTLKQPGLAAALERIAKDKYKGFYEGQTADDIVATVQRHNGLITHNDLKNYRAVWRKPVMARFGRYTVVSMPPPSSGGIALAQLLYGFERLKGDTLRHNSAPYVHLLTELERRVYADRADYLGDMDFYPVPVGRLLDTTYLNERFSNISMDTATPSREIKSGNVEDVESFETTHYIVADSAGNVVSVTTTINSYFGSKVVVAGSGFLLNNEMDDFSVKPGVPNQFGLVGSEANRIEPGKRMLSSMTPVVVLHDKNFVLAVGTPGGATIITSVFQTLLNTLVYDMPVQEAVNAPKFHSQWLPDVIFYEEDKVGSALLDSLRAMHHEPRPVKQLGKMKLVLLENGCYRAATDTLRGDDGLAVPGE